MSSYFIYRTLAECQATASDPNFNIITDDSMQEFVFCIPEQGQAQ
jgi:hypothetical protein